MKIRVKSLGISKHNGYCFLNVVTPYGDKLSAFVRDTDIDSVSEIWPSGTILVVRLFASVYKGQPRISFNYDLPDLSEAF